MAITDGGHSLFAKSFSQMRPHVIVGGKPTHNRTSNAIFTTRTQGNRSLFSRDDTFPEVLRSGPPWDPYGRVCCSDMAATNEIYDNYQTHFNYRNRPNNGNFFSGFSGCGCSNV